MSKRLSILVAAVVRMPAADLLDRRREGRPPDCAGDRQLELQQSEPRFWPIRKTMRRMSPQPFARVGFEVVQAIDANKRDLDLSMAKFARLATDADAALFYYAGHARAVSGPQLPDADRCRSRGRDQPSLPDDADRRRSRRAGPRRRRQDDDPRCLPQQSDRQRASPQEGAARPAPSMRCARPRQDRQDAGHGGRLFHRGR